MIKRRYAELRQFLTLSMAALLIGACAAEPQPVAPATVRPEDAQVTAANLSSTPDPPTPTPTTEPTATSSPSPTPEAITALRGAALLDALRTGGYVIYFRHAATDPAQTDSDTRSLANCEQQRNLTDQGRASASLIGQAFLALEIPVDRVLSSGYCRARHTAQIAFGKTEIASALTGSTRDLPAERSAALQQMLSRPPRRGMNTVLVGHDANLSGGADILMSEGEAAIFMPLGPDGFTLISRLLPETWVELAGLDGSTAQYAADHADGPSSTATEPTLAQSTGSPVPQLPDLQTLPPSDLVIEIATPGGRKALRLTNSIVNRGPGAMELYGLTNQASGKTTVTQRIYAQNGTFEEHATGEFIFHPGHAHWHLEDFARYEVWSLSPRGDLDAVVALTDKVSYCLRDDTRADMPGAAAQAVYTNCNQDVQGIAPGWIDTYKHDTQGQIVDITNVPNGAYALRSTVDPEDRLREADEENNAATVYIEISGDQVQVTERPGG